jgi:hypothetical protein
LALLLLTSSPLPLFSHSLQFSIPRFSIDLSPHLSLLLDLICPSLLLSLSPFFFSPLPFLLSPLPFLLSPSQLRLLSPSFFLLPSQFSLLSPFLF